MSGLREDHVRLTANEVATIRELVALMGIGKVAVLLGTTKETLNALRSPFGTVAKDTHARIMKRLEIVRAGGTP